MILVSTSAYAIEVRKTGAIYEKLVTYVASQVINPILSSRFNERKITDNIEIIVQPSGGLISDLHTAIAIPSNSSDNNKALIVISDGFIHGLDQYIATHLIGYQLSDKHLSERYFNYYFWRLRPVNDGEMPLPPEDWLGYTPKSFKKFKQGQSQLLIVALTDILLHEIGHHVTDGFYDQFTSKKKMKKIEKKADKWSQNAFSGDMKGATAIGRFFAVGYIFELERLTQFSNIGTHPPHLDRVWLTMDDLCVSLGSERKDMCERFKQDVSLTFNAKANEKEYRQRISDGEVYAHFPLANILLKRGNRKEACNHYILAWEKAKVERATIHIGSCYDNEYLQDKSNKKALANAKKFYRKAADLGFTDAKVYIRKFFN